MIAIAARHSGGCKTKVQKTYKTTIAQELLRTHLQELGIETRFEYMFAPPNRWRLDLYSESLHMGFECNGGRYGRGHRSSRDTDIENNKMNTAQILGIRVLQFTNEAILTGRALAWLKENL